MKKILLVIPTLEQGGGQKFVMDLAQKLDKNKFQVRVLVFYKKNNSVFDLFAEKNGIDTVYLDKQVGLDIGFFKQVKKALKEYAPDVIHTNLDSLLYLLPFYKRKQIKIHTIHTLAEKEAIGLQRVVRFIAYKIVNVKPIGISDTVADSIAAEHGIPREAIDIVYNGVDCARYDLPKKESSTINFVTVGTIYYVKNYDFLIDCFYNVCQKYDNLHLSILGDGILRQELENKIKKLDLVDKVTITGVVSDVEIYLSKADIYVATSLFEGLPLSMLEAMSAGLPIISTNVGGVKDIIRDGENGILVESGNENAYTKAMEQMISDSEKRLSYARKSKQLSKNYDIRQMVEGYEKIYQGR